MSVVCDLRTGLLSGAAQIDFCVVGGAHSPHAFDSGLVQWTLRSLDRHWAFRKKKNAIFINISRLIVPRKSSRFSYCVFQTFCEFCLTIKKKKHPRSPDPSFSSLGNYIFVVVIIRVNNRAAVLRLYRVKAALNILIMKKKIVCVEKIIL